MIDVEVEDAAWVGALPEVETVVSRAAERALVPLSREAGEGARAGVYAPPQSASLRGLPLRGRAEVDLTVLLTDDARVRALNASFRGKDGSTNVLSFPAPATAAPHLGDIALAYGVCAREAAEQGKRLDQHVTHLVVHGVLHLLGYDHLEDDEAETMEALERTLCADLGWPDPYADAPALERHG